MQSLIADNKIDWHNHEQIEKDAQKTGVGEQGKPAYLSKNEESEKEALYKVNGFNALLSDKIDLKR